jgi:hypothetical protein
MRTRIARVVTVWLAALLVNSAAFAASITVAGGTAGTIPTGATNDFIPALLPGPVIGGYFGATITLDAPVSTPITIDFFGAEAGFVNAFEFFGGTLFTHPGGGAVIAPSLSAPLGSISGFISGTGILPFRFLVDSAAGAVANGSNPDDSGGAVTGPNFFASCNPFGPFAGSGGIACNTVYLFLDDGGAGPDDDHDDLFVRISVPEPATLALFGLGLLGYLTIRRRRHQQ